MISDPSPPDPSTHRLGGYREHTPPPGLVPYVDAVWAYGRRVGAPAIPGNGHRVLPDTGVSLCYECRRDEYGRVLIGRVVVMGPIRTTRRFDPPAGFHLEGLRLKPEWTQALLAISPRDHVDRVDDLGEATTPAVAGPLEDRLVRTTSSVEACGALVAWVHDRLFRMADPAGARLAHEGLERVRAARSTTIRTHEVAGTLAVSERHLRRVIQELTGLSPKHHQRIQRLGRVVAAADALPDAPRWARLAVAAGYYDQPHLIREFRALAGLTPGEVHRERARQRGSTDE